MNEAVKMLDERIITRIYLLREKRVMLDRDLAELYGVETKRLKEAVRRNITRFPPDFMFEMSNWRSQIATSNFEGDKMGWRHTPFCFTEQGVAMLSSVLNSQAAIDVNIQIIRVFTKMRESLLTHKDILIKLEQIEKEMINQDNKTKQSEGHIQIIFKALKELLNPPKVPRPRIGFKRNDEME